MLTCVSFWFPSTIVVLFVLFMTIRTSTPGSGDPTDPVNKSESTKKSNFYSLLFGLCDVIGSRSQLLTERLVVRAPPGSPLFSKFSPLWDK